MKFTIAYTSPSEPTKAIAEFLKEKLKQLEGIETAVEILAISTLDSSASIDPGTDVVIIGTSVSSGRFPKPLIQWIHDRREQLRSKIVAFFYVNLDSLKKEFQSNLEQDQLLKKLISMIDFVPGYAAGFGSKTNEGEYGWLKRLIINTNGSSIEDQTQPRSYENINWEHVNAFLEAIKKQDKSSSFSMQGNFSQLNRKSI